MELDVRKSNKPYIKGQENSFRLGSNSIIMSLLRDKMYSDIPLAIVREYLSNALDAHNSIGLNRPIHVKLPTLPRTNSELIESNVFSIRDYGTGISPEVMTSTFSVYGVSTKDSNDIGGFGIGAKVGLAISDQFNIISICRNDDGTHTQYFYKIYLKNGEDTWSLIEATPTTEETGTLIEIPIPIENIDDIRNNYHYITSHWDGFLPAPIGDTPDSKRYALHNTSECRIKWSLIKQAEYRNKSLGSSYNTYPIYVLLVGGIPYRIDGEEYRQLFKTSLSNRLESERSILVIWVEPSDINMSSGRESITYGERTSRLINKLSLKVDNILRDISISAQVIVDSCRNLWEIKKRLGIWNGSLFTGLTHRDTELRTLGPKYLELISLNDSLLPPHYYFYKTRYDNLSKTRVRYEGNAVSMDIDSTFILKDIPASSEEFLSHLHHSTHRFIDGKKEDIDRLREEYFLLRDEWLGIKLLSDVLSEHVVHKISSKVRKTSQRGRREYYLVGSNKSNDNVFTAYDKVELNIHEGDNIYLPYMYESGIRGGIAPLPGTINGGLINPDQLSSLTRRYLDKSVYCVGEKEVEKLSTLPNWRDYKSAILDSIDNRYIQALDLVRTQQGIDEPLDEWLTHLETIMGLSQTRLGLYTCNLAKRVYDNTVGISRKIVSSYIKDIYGIWAFRSHLPEIHYINRVGSGSIGGVEVNSNALTRLAEQCIVLNLLIDQSSWYTSSSLTHVMVYEPTLLRDLYSQCCDQFPWLYGCLLGQCNLPYLVELSQREISNPLINRANE